MRISRLAGALVACAASLFLAVWPIAKQGQHLGSDTPSCQLESGCAARNPRIERITLLQATGARPRFDPTGTSIAFDRKNADGYYDVYVSSLNGEIIRSVTEKASEARADDHDVVHFGDPLESVILGI